VDDWSSARWPLGDQLDRWLDRCHIAADRLIGAGAGADVNDGLRIAERRFDLCGDPRVGAAGVRVADAYAVVGRLAHRLALTSTGQLTLLAMKQRSWARWWSESSRASSRSPSKAIRGRSTTRVNRAPSIVPSGSSS